MTHSKDGDVRALRSELLGARSIAAVTRTAEGFVRSLNSQAAARLVPESERREPAWIPASEAEPVMRAWLETLGARVARVVPMRGSTALWVAVAGASEPDTRITEALAVVASDIDHALELVAAFEQASEIASLREQLTQRDELVRRAGEALVRDSAEVVGVVAELERRDASMKSDLQQALRFQRAAIAPLPVDEALEFDALFVAADVISGDFYDVASRGPGSHRIFVADATGHGVAAGLATMFIKSEYEAVKRDAGGPASLLATLNERFASRFRSLELRFTAVCVDVQEEGRRMRWACAAHPAPFVARATGPERLPSGGSFVGLVADLVFPEHETELARGDVVGMFTDGLPDAVAPDGEAFGEERIIDALVDARVSGAAVCPWLVRALSRFVGEGRSLVDDVAIVTFRVKV